MLPWNVKFDDAQFETLAASVHRALNRQRPDGFDDAANVVRREIGSDFVIALRPRSIAIHPASTIPGVDAPRAILIRRNQKRSRRLLRPRQSQPKRADSPWTKVIPCCSDCGKGHVLYYGGPVAPIIYGYVCPESGNIVVMRTDVEGWSHDHWGDVRVFAVALPKPDRLRAEA